MKRYFIIGNSLVEISVRFLLVVLNTVVIRRETALDQRNFFINPENFYSYAKPYDNDAQVPSSWLHAFDFCWPTLVYITWLFLSIDSFKPGRRNLKKETALLELYAFILYFSLAYILTLITVSMGKYWVQRPRPDFLGRCFPTKITPLGSGQDISIDREFLRGIYNSTLPSTSGQILSKCDSEENYSNLEKSRVEILEDSTKSFPSGHAGFSSVAAFATMFFIFGKTGVFSSISHYFEGTSCSYSTIRKFLLSPICGLLIGSIGWFISIWIAITRFQDYRHAALDVLVGHFVGFIMAFFSFYIYYPPLSSEKVDCKLLTIQKSKNRISQTELHTGVEHSSIL